MNQEDQMQAIKSIKLYLSEDELKEAIVLWLKDTGHKDLVSHTYGNQMTIERDGGAWSILIDGEL